MSESIERVTYATLAAGQTDEFRRRYDEAVDQVRGALGQRLGHYIDGREIAGPGSEHRGPADRRLLLAEVPSADPELVAQAVVAARRGCPRWRRTPWTERVAILQRAAALIEERGFELSALVGLEAGKTRLEATGDVTEAADLIRYYCQQMEKNHGFDRPMSRLSPEEETRSVMRPYGVWAVISPFNFPVALAGGPLAGALVTGNTCVLKPSFFTPLTAFALYRVFREAGVPESALHLVHGPGETGRALASDPGVDGLLFTGSREVGMSVLRGFERGYPRPCITEMGGKNPALVMASADLEAAAEGVMKSAFGLQGQKCSACSRVYVHEAVKDRFVELLLEKTRGLVIGDPSRHGVDLGPVIHEQAWKRFETSAALARSDGRILGGGETLREGEYAHGYFVTPTVVDGLPENHALFREEIFLPFLCVASVSSLAEALGRANGTDYGLTAGLFSRDPVEIDDFLEQIQAGVVYVNRRAGATTGAWPGVQPFGGWKGSGSTGKASGGLYYLPQFMREQSRTLVH